MYPEFLQVGLANLRGGISVKEHKFERECNVVRRLHSERHSATVNLVASAT